MMEAVEAFPDPITHKLLEGNGAMSTAENRWVCCNDLHAAFQFILEGEPADMEANADSGLEAWRRLWRRYFFTTNARAIQKMQRILKPETVKKISQVLPAIERWEEDIKLYDSKNQVSEEMKTAIVSTIPP